MSILKITNLHANVEGKEILKGVNLEISEGETVSFDVKVTHITGLIVPNKKVTIKDGDKVVPETEYRVEYSNNVNVGTATIIITGKGNYTGQIIKTFNIVKASYNTNNIKHYQIPFS